MKNQDQPSLSSSVLNAEEKRLQQLLLVPPSSYDADAYNTLCSVVQGVACAALFYEMSTLPSIWSEPLSYTKALCVFLLIITLWHHYVMNNRYAAPRIMILDTFIPFCFAALQSALALSISSENWWFPFWLSFCSLLGVFAYYNIDKRFGDNLTHLLFIEHFMGNEDFSKVLIEESRHFYRRSQKLLLVSATIMAVLTLISYHVYGIFSCYMGWITSVAAAIIILISIQQDLPWYLNRKDSELHTKYPLYKY